MTPATSPARVHHNDPSLTPRDANRRGIESPPGSPAEPGSPSSGGHRRQQQVSRRVPVVTKQRASLFWFYLLFCPFFRGLVRARIREWNESVTENEKKSFRTIIRNVTKCELKRGAKQVLAVEESGRKKEKQLFRITVKVRSAIAVWIWSAWRKGKLDHSNKYRLERKKQSVPKLQAAKMLKIQMLEQIVANENVLEDDQVASVAAAAAAASGSNNSGGGSSKDENEETKSLNRHNRLSPQG